MSSYGIKNIDLDPYIPETCPHRRVLYAIFWRALLDACCMTEETARSLHVNNNDRALRRDARYWFECKSRTLGGWYWLAHLLEFPQAFVDDVHQRIANDQVIVHPFVPRAQAEARMAGVVKRVRKTIKVVKKLSAQLSLGICDNEIQTAPPTARAAKAVREVYQAALQQDLWAYNGHE